MEKQDLIRYRTFADALIRLNNAASTLLQEGADPEAIKLILAGTAKLFAELEHRMAQVLPEDAPRNLDLHFPDDDEGWGLAPPAGDGVPRPVVPPTRFGGMGPLQTGEESVN
jgi:hypothetical protein